MFFFVVTYLLVSRKCGLIGTGAHFEDTQATQTLVHITAGLNVPIH